MTWKYFSAIAGLLLLNASLHGQAPGPFETTSLTGVRLVALSDDGTILTAQRALAGEPKSEGLALKLSLAQAGRRQYKEAIATDTVALADHPGSAPLYLERGHRELGLRQFAEAQKDLAKAAQLDPKVLESFYLWA